MNLKRTLVPDHGGLWSPREKAELHLRFMSRGVMLNCVFRKSTSMYKIGILAARRQF